MIYCLGESLLDIVQHIHEPVDTKRDMAHAGIPGGAMLNTAVSLARTGLPVSLITELGDDSVADFIMNFLTKNKINTQYVRQYQQMKTSVAIAVLDNHKKPVYHLEKHYPKKRQLAPVSDFKKIDVLLFGSLYSLDGDLRNELLTVLHTAHEAGCTIIYDPNIRKESINLNGKAGEKVIENIKAANVIKASDEDLTALFGQNSPKRLLQLLADINPEALAIITLGASGVYALWKNEIIRISAKKINVISTVGAGDAFNAGFIYEWIQKKLNRDKLSALDWAEVESMLEQGVLFSAAVCTSNENYISQGFIPKQLPTNTLYL